MIRSLKALAVVAVIALFAQVASAGFTLFDLAKDAMFIARGEFTSLERTSQGDRLVLRCDKMIKGDRPAGGVVTLEPFEVAPADVALGRDVIVGFNYVNGKYYFNLHPFSWRSFYFNDSDSHPDGLNLNEQALRRFIDINRPHQSLIQRELERRLELESAGYAGDYTKELLDEWQEELMVQMSWAGTIAARDAAKALCEHALFGRRATVEQLRQVGKLLPSSKVGSIERSYMLELVRNEISAHPPVETLIAMMREETFDACVGKLANLFLAVENRTALLEQIGGIAENREEATQVRVNALQVLGALRDVAALPFVHNALIGEQEMGEEFDKNVVRGVLKAMRSLPDTSSESVLEAYMEDPQCAASWELTRRTWIAYSMIDSERTNERVKAKALAETHPHYFRFYARLLNPINRQLILVFNED
jgi:hypothetical protein